MAEKIQENDYLMHYGKGHLDGGHSGRYPWGSGEVPFQRAGDFVDRVNQLKREGKTEKQIAEELKTTTTSLRPQYGVASDIVRMEKTAKIKQLLAEGKNKTEIAKIMGYKNESSIRALLNPEAEASAMVARKAADFLEEQADKKNMVDVGKGVEYSLNVSRTRMDQALEIARREGYEVYIGGVPQVTNKGQQTNRIVLCKPGTPHKDIYQFDKVQTVEDYISNDGGETFDKKWVYPKSLDSSRLKINYATEDGKGGALKDGLIELRRGVDDISLGESHYSQVRILVDGTHYLKGMAVYSDDIPDGYDVVFNTNKKEGTPALGTDKKNTVLKMIKRDKDGNPQENPFGSAIKEGIYDPDSKTALIDEKNSGQRYYYDKNGKKQLSVINKRADEGDWNDWQRKIPAQFLAKQNKDLAKKQLDLDIADKKLEYETIMSLTNPTVKKNQLETFANDCDSAAVHLKAAAFPGESYKVIMPLKSIKDNEVFAPTYEPGTKLALVRFPHGGTFEIPILTVNNKNKEGLSTISNLATDAIGINSKVASVLSGADFDGDTVMCIPTSKKVHITSRVGDNSPEFKKLEGFDPKLEYGGKEKGTFKEMKNTQNEMGKISNLITDMTIKGADDSEVVRAVKHSMVVIDAEKHGLDYKQSEVDNGIKELRNKYMGRYEDGKWKTGASTLISRASAEFDVPKRKGQAIVDKETGEKKWEYVDKKTGEVKNKYANESYLQAYNPENKKWVAAYKNKDGSIVYKNNNEYVPLKDGMKTRTQERTQKSTQMAETNDARTLISKDARSPIEFIYADYANEMKALANSARKANAETKGSIYNKEAAKQYRGEVDSLNEKLTDAFKNHPRETQAQRLANAEIKIKEKEYPDLTNEEKRKISNQALVKARARVGAKRTLVDITDKEWEAIQAGAITNSKLTQILNHTDIDKLRERAMPKERVLISPAKVNKMEHMKNSGYTINEIAKAIGCSPSTVSKYL